MLAERPHITADDTECVLNGMQCSMIPLGTLNISGINHPRLVQ